MIKKYDNIIKRGEIYERKNIFKKEGNFMGCIEIIIVLFIIILLIMAIRYILVFSCILLLTVVFYFIVKAIVFYPQYNKLRKNYEKYKISFLNRKPMPIYNPYKDCEGYLLIENEDIKYLFEPVKFTKYLLMIIPTFEIEILIKDIDEIAYFREEGNVENHQYISGNISGGGSSIGGAVLGNMVYGDVGALIGSRKKVEGSLSTRYEKYDDRRIEIVFKDSKKILVSTQCYEYLLNNLPKKDYETVINYKKELAKKEMEKENN